MSTPSTPRTLRFARLLLIGSAATAGLGRAALAQTFPQRTITIIAPTAPGGPADTAARLIAERMSPRLGQTIVVEGVPGAGGTTGVTRVARAAPDGYTLLIHQTGMAIAPAISSTLAFDPETDFTVVGLVNTSTSVLIGRGSLPAGSWAELRAWMAGPGRPAKIGHPGVGSLGHLTTLMFAQAVSADIDAVAYRGVVPIMNDMLGGHVDLVFAGAVNAVPQIEAGTVKAYAIASAKRSPVMPKVPSVAELGFPGLEVQFWHALFAPAATPKPIVDTLNAALRFALADPALLKAFETGSVEAFPREQQSPEAGGAFVRSEIARWRKVVQQVNLPK